MAGTKNNGDPLQEQHAVVRMPDDDRDYRGDLVLVMPILDRSTAEVLVQDLEMPPSPPPTPESES